jgi:hypothetical protein
MQQDQTRPGAVDTPAQPRAIAFEEAVCGCLR